MNLCGMLKASSSWWLLTSIEVLDNHNRISNSSRDLGCINYSRSSIEFLFVLV